MIEAARGEGRGDARRHRPPGRRGRAADRRACRPRAGARSTSTPAGRARAGRRDREVAKAIWPTLEERERRAALDIDGRRHAAEGAATAPRRPPRSSSRSASGSRPRHASPSATRACSSWPTMERRLDRDRRAGSPSSTSAQEKLQNAEAEYRPPGAQAENLQREARAAAEPGGADDRRRRGAGPRSRSTGSPPTCASARRGRPSPRAIWSGARRGSTAARTRWTSASASSTTATTARAARCPDQGARGGRRPAHGAGRPDRGRARGPARRPGRRRGSRSTASGPCCSGGWPRSRSARRAAREELDEAVRAATEASGGRGACGCAATAGRKAVEELHAALRRRKPSSRPRSGGWPSSSAALQRREADLDPYARKLQRSAAADAASARCRPSDFTVERAAEVHDEPRRDDDDPTPQAAQVLVALGDRSTGPSEHAE